MRILIGFAALAASTSAYAAPIALWGNITSETQAAQVIGLVDSTKYDSVKVKPDATIFKNYKLSPHCTLPKLSVNHPNGVVDKVKMEFVGSYCIEELKAGLAEKYGEPMTNGRSGMLVSWHSLNWSKGGKAISMTMYDGLYAGDVSFTAGTVPTDL